MQIIRTIPKLKPRAIDTHKGNFGRVLIIAGSFGISGAAAGRQRRSNLRHETMEDVPGR